MLVINKRLNKLKSRLPLVSSWQPASGSSVSGQQGFTLLEVLVALAIVGAIFVALLLLVSQVLDARSQLATARSQGQDQLVDFLTRTDRQLSQLVARQTHELGQVLNPAPLTLLNNNRELYWVAAGQWVLPLNDYATRLRLWRLVLDTVTQQLRLESSGLLDAADAQVWTLVAQLDQVSELEWSFYRNNAWQNTLEGSFPTGLRLALTWQGANYERLILLPELKILSSSAAAGQNSSNAEEEDADPAAEATGRNSRSRGLRSRNQTTNEAVDE